ncbi:MAG: tetratricopeptide repeat protein [Vicinamibacterales bacterium]|nr:tetratricopeptide repeat protein [Vicinamibacterales bacterium]
MRSNGHTPDVLRRSRRASLIVVAIAVLATVLATAGCSKLGQLTAMKNFKEANAAYGQQDYKRAAELYEEALKADPNLNFTYFYLGNSYDNLYKPSKKGEPENDQLLEKAVQNYQTAAEKLTTGPTKQEKDLAQLSLKFLVATFGADKLNDPARAEPVVQRMIQLDPGEPENYFALGKIYEDAGAYDNAEEILQKAKEAKPKDPAVYKTLAGYYNRQGQFEKTIKELEEGASVDVKNPEAHYTIAVFYWDAVFRDVRLKEPEKRDYVQKGLAEVEKALDMKSDYIDAIVYKGLLLRSQALLEKDVAKQQSLIKEATQLSEKANNLRKQKASGTGN